MRPKYMSRLQRLPTVLKTHISTFLSYHDKKVSYRTLECKRPERPVIRIDVIPEIYNSFLIEDKSIPAHPSLRGILLEDWFLPIINKSVIDTMLPANVIQLCILKAFVNNMFGRDGKVYMQCPQCRMYCPMDLILFYGKLILDLYYVDCLIKKEDDDYDHTQNVYYCDCMTQQYPPNTVGKDDAKGNGHHKEPNQEFMNVIKVQYGLCSRTGYTETQNLYQQRDARYTDYDIILKIVLQLYGYQPTRNDLSGTITDEDSDEEELADEESDGGFPSALPDGRYELP